MEYLDDEALNIYTDGSSLPRPRRGGIGIVFVSVDDSGNERLDEYPMPGYPGGTNQEMELQAPIQALVALIRGQAPVDHSRFKKIVIWTDSQYVTENIHSALYIWPSNDWMTRDGNPVVNARLWQEFDQAHLPYLQKGRVQMGQGPQAQPVQQARRQARQAVG